MYANIAEHSECPTDDIINDDDALDGWMVFQRRQRDKHRTQKEVDTLLNKHKDSEEIYIVADDPAQIQKINDLNNPQAQMIKRQREAVLAHRDIVNEQDLPDVRRAAQMKATEESMKGVRRG
jgi:hypothetical protein